MTEFHSRCGRIHLYNMDCMDFMRRFEDGFFDLAVVDPPYGIEKGVSATSRIAKYGQMSTVNDMRPDASYFVALWSVSANQIVWGWNHLADMLPPTKEFVFWFKHQPVPTYSDGELAWTSFTKTAKCFDFPFFGGVGAEVERIHPTQKPVKLYEWLFSHYAKPDDWILDTHLGSGSSAIAAHRMGFEFWGCELDADYFAAAVARFERETAQADMFGGAVDEVDCCASSDRRDVCADCDCWKATANRCS